MLSGVLGIFPIRDRIKPLRNLRSKPQVSEVFDARSVRIDAYCIELRTADPGRDDDRRPLTLRAPPSADLAPPLVPFQP